MSEVRDAIHVVREKITQACQRAGRSPVDVRLIGVTKRVEAARVREAMAEGLRDFGENYVQVAKKKIENLDGEITWHMIGHVQSNKINYVARSFSYVHSVDRLELLEGLERAGRGIAVLFEVNLSGEPQKHGTTVDGLRDMVERIGELRHVRPIGLMTVPPLTAYPEEARPVFAALRETMEAVNKEFGLSLTELSMGMSADFTIAIEEGATMVRIGTAIFGERQ